MTFFSSPRHNFAALFPLRLKFKQYTHGVIGNFVDLVFVIIKRKEEKGIDPSRDLHCECNDQGKKK